jgi:two-component sensor histidine kinase/CheY-like chemotaxis protein
MNMTAGFGPEPVRDAPQRGVYPTAKVPGHMAVEAHSVQPPSGRVQVSPEGPLEIIVPQHSENPIMPATAGEPINILIVDDEPKNLAVLETVLNDPAYRLVRADSANSALLALLAQEFALLILDINMPVVSGFELAQMIKERKRTSQVPIIFLTAYYSEDQHVLEGYGAGAVDYLHKPVNPVVLRSKVAVFVELSRKQREVQAANRALVTEIASRQKIEQQLRELNSTLEQHVAERTRNIESLLNEVNHRSKNILGIVMAMAKQTAAASSPEEFVQRFTERVKALSTHQDLLIKNQWRSLDLSTLVCAQLAPFEDFIGRRIIIGGPPVLVVASAAQTIGMAVHELATNAVKYGALSDSKGEVNIAWQINNGDARERRFVMCWQESSGPPVHVPSRRGFGSKVIKSMVELSLDGEVSLDFAAPGLLWQLDCPAVRICEDL